jgi:hypothetical protein
MAAKKLAALQHRIFHKKLRIASNTGATAQVVGRVTLGWSNRRQFARRANLLANSTLPTHLTPVEAAGIRVAQ